MTGKAPVPEDMTGVGVYFTANNELKSALAQNLATVAIASGNSRSLFSLV